jgi:hypothetical protein
MSKEKERFHLPHVFNMDYYELIDDFQGEKVSMLPCMLGMRMLKAMRFTDHLHKKFMMRMKISIHKRMFKELQI